MTDGTVEQLARALKRLDGLLEIAVKQIASNEEFNGSADLYRGLQIRCSDVERLLDSPSCAPAFRLDGCFEENALGEDVPRLSWLGRTFGLSDFDLNVMLMALAPELDLRYERLYAYLQDDVTRRRPTVDLALNLFSRTPEEKLTRRSRFCAEAPLIRNKLVQLIPDPAQVQPPLLSQYLKVEDQMVAFITGENGLDQRLAAFCRFHTDGAEDGIAEPQAARTLSTLAIKARDAGRPLTVYFQGAGSAAKRRAGEALSRACGARLLMADLAQAPETLAAFQEALQLLFREASLRNAFLYIDGLDLLHRDTRAALWQSFAERLAEFQGISLLCGARPWIPMPRGPVGVLTVRFDVLDRTRAFMAWKEQMEKMEVQCRDEDVLLVADRFRLTSEQIADAVACARNEALWQKAISGDDSNTEAKVASEELCAAARAECGHDLSGLARKIRPKYTWLDIVLPSDQLEQLQEVCQQAKHWQTVFGEWGFDRKLSLGKGLNVLFSGPPGTGKTMAAEVLVSDLQLDLYKIDLSQIVSKYIGETEKNLDRIFALAENSNAILFFDEADALFGKRSEVKDSHDRYANIEVGYLLQKMEEYEGIAILATNVRHHIDEAFVRRMHAIIEFPFPEEAERKRVWQVIFPDEAPVDTDVDYGALARSIRLAGGNIRNIARASAFYAASDGGTIRMRHIVKASRREYQKLGRTWNENEWRDGSAEPAFAEVLR